jgi:pyruvate,orthophosphate dikinase
MTVEVAAHCAQLAGSAIAEGDWITVDGHNGGIYLGRRDIVVERPEAELAEVARWRITATSKSAAAVG